MTDQPTATYIGLAPLDDQQLNDLRTLESEIGAVLIALKPAVPLASLTPDQLTRLQQYEKDHGLIVLACQK